MSWGNLNKSRLVLLVALLFTALGAGVFRTSSIIFMAAMLCGAPLVGWGLGRFLARGLRISREMPGIGSVGQTIRVKLRLKNNAPFPAFLVTAISFLDEAHLPWAEKRGAPFVQAIDIVGEPNLVTPSVPAHGEVTGEVNWLLKRRGVYHVPGAGAGAFDPIGLYTHFPTRTAPSELIIVPRPLRLHRLEIGSGGRGVQKPQARPTAATAADLHGVRPYQRGESVRRVHWKSTARTGELHVIEWEEETARDLCVFLDVQAQSIAGPIGRDTLESAIIAAVSAAGYALDNGQTVHLFWWKIEGAHLALEHLRAHHRAALGKILLAFAELKSVPNPDATLDALVERTREIGPLPEAALFLGSDLSRGAAALSLWGHRAAKFLCFQSSAFESLAALEAAPPLENQEKTAATAKGLNTSKDGTQSGVAFSADTQRESAWSGGTLTQSRDVVLLRPGDSIAAALEKRT